MVSKSPILEKIYGNAQQLANQYGSNYLTQAHFLMAILEIYADEQNALNQEPELQKIFQDLSIPMEKRKKTLDRAQKRLRIRSHSSYEEFQQMEKAYENAAATAEAADVDVITVEMLFYEIILMPSPLAERYFPIFMPFYEAEVSGEIEGEEAEASESESEMLRAVFSESKALAEKYSDDDVSQVHFLYALLAIYLQPENQENPELLNALAEISKDPMVINAAMGLAHDWIRMQEVPKAETAAFTHCCENAIGYAWATKQETLTVGSLLTEIIDYPSEKALELFGNVFPLKGSPMRKFIEPEPEEEKSVFASDLLDPLKRLQVKLRARVYGQDEAVDALVAGCFNLLLEEEAESFSDQPNATFLFAGAPGVGKTHLAQEAAQALRLPFRRFDMSGFSDKEATLEFAGTDRVYKSAHEGLVTGFVKRHPRCVLLFDEIEKAHTNIIHLFLQILDAGKLKDSYTKKDVSFSNAIIIMTTNAGKSLYEELEPGAPMPNRKTVLNALATEINPQTNAPFFPAAICSRFAAGNVVLFNPLGVQNLIKIGRAAIEERIEQVEHRFKKQISCDKNLCAALLFAEGNKADARSLSGRARNFIASEVYNWLKFAYEKDEDGLNNTETLRIRIPARGDAKRLFEPQGAQNILLYSENKDAFKNFVSNGEIKILQAKTLENALELAAAQEIAFAVCDIFGDEQPTLNIEDTASEGRKLMEQLIKADVPTYVYQPTKRNINIEERHALMQNGAAGLIKQASAKSVSRTLKTLCMQVHTEKTLRELARSKKVLSFDCIYNWEKGRKVGIIDLVNLRVIPAIDADDRDDMADLCMTDTTFDEVIGAEDAKAELQGFISYLKNPKLYSKNRIPAPKGVLLFGPPGTGKTMLAKAFAHESGAAFIAASGNQFLSSRKGGGAREVRRLFALARKYAPTVLFIDEIDIVAKNRLLSSESDDVVNALLNELDGFSTNANRPVFVLAATNFDAGFGRKSVLDPALLRRFDRRIFVDLPNAKERSSFIQLRLQQSKQKLSDASIANLVSRSVGMSLAELESAIDFALRCMVREGKAQLTEAMMNEAFETFLFGQAEEQNEAQLKRVAIHEAGHAILEYMSGSKPCYITITGRGGFGGYVQPEESADGIYTAQQLRNKIRMLLGGRAAEMVIYGETDGISTGAASDLSAATEWALQMITVYGMCQEGGLMSRPEERGSQATAELCNRILGEEMQHALQKLEQQKELLHRLAAILLEKNHLMGNELEAFFKEMERSEK